MVAALRRAPTRGYTLLEMTVVLAIIAIIMTIAFSGQAGFSRALVLENTSYDVALSIREAEGFGIASRTFAAVDNSGYGVRFTKTPNTSYVFYADAYPAPGDPANCHCNNSSCAALPDAKPGNCLYDASYGAGGTELVSQYTFGAGIAVADFCGVYSSDGTTHCAVAEAGDLASLDIVYVRPNTQATLTATTNGALHKLLSSAVIYLAAGTAERCVSANAVGQISVLASCPTPP